MKDGFGCAVVCLFVYWGGEERRKGGGPGYEDARYRRLESDMKRLKLVQAALVNCSADALKMSTLFLVVSLKVWGIIRGKSLSVVD